MLNLVMTQSSRMAAMATGHTLGEDAARSHSVLHRMAWLRLRKERAAQPATETHAAEQALRERTA